MVAKFHTHPNLGPNWNPGPSAIDGDGDGVPDRGDGQIVSKRYYQ